MLLTLLTALFLQGPQQDTIKTHQLDEVVISSVRADKLVPVTESTLKSVSIESNYAGQELPVFLAKTPSITWYSEGGNNNGYSYMRLRGIDQTRINFTLNGVPLNEPEDQGAYFANYQDVLNSVKSLQIQRGVGTSSYGTTSFGGSINLESPSLREPSKIEQQISYGSFNTQRVSTEFNSGVVNNFSLYARYSQISSDGFRNNSGTKGKSFFMSGGYFDDKNMIKVVSFFGETQNEMSYLAASESDLKKDYTTNYLSKNENDHFNQAFANVQYTRILSENTNLLVSTYYNRLTGSYGVFFDPDLLNFSLASNFTGVIANLQYDNGRINSNTGVHANTYNRTHTLQILPDIATNLYDNTGFKNEVSAFQKVSYLIQNITFYGDLQLRNVNFRYSPDAAVTSQYDDIAWTFFNPKFGVTVETSPNKLVYASVGKTSREPTRNDMFAGYDNLDESNYAEVGDFSRVKPETVTDVELGIKFGESRINIDANLYLMYFKNEIAAIGQLSYIGLPLRKNVPSSYRKGIEFTAETKLSSKLTSITNANLSRNRITEYTTDYDSKTYTDVQPLLTPEVVINQGLEYKLSEKFSVDLNGKYISQSFLDNTNNTTFTTPESLVFNGGTTVVFGKIFTLNLVANNITNQKYYMSGYVVGDEAHYFPIATRNYTATLKINIK